MHLSLLAGIRGNPRFYMTYLDESLNKIFIRIAKTCHRSTFERTLFGKYAGWHMRNPMDSLVFW